ncbi:hypothetical protein BOX15_Mlig002173g1 [Macrostomum lignano]|uniref:PKD domain-containing protein n=1 Tax=Macrostomum lignano TaxID=282301 RepID=A0A267FN36_9PLAT|nr:hypothetical protein BOX15_Mlig002173g1 [Macrostomum lignano]
MRLMATLPAFLLGACALLLPPEASAVTFAGCFEEKSQERVFIQSPGDYDPDLLATEPVVCTSRCQQMSFAYAAIWQSRFCFCSDNINQTADFNITDLAAAACTAPEYVAVYNSEIATSIEDLEVTVGATTEVAVNTPLEVKALNVSAPLSNTFSTRLGYADDRFRKELIMSNGYATNKSYIQPGVFNIKAQAYQYENTVIGSGALQIKVTEPLSGINLTCPSVWITEKQMQCVLSIASGTGLRALINWGDGTTENFIVADPPWDRAGSPVATQNSEMENSSITGALVAADFKFEGTLQAFEFFAHTAGSLELLILRPACSGGTPYYCYSKDICDASNACNSDIDCAATSEILCPATENCWQASGSTCATKATKRNVTRSLHSTFNVAKKYSVSAQVGYNLLPVTDQFLVLPGDKIGFWGSVAIVAARPVSVVEGNDYSFSSVSSPTTLTTSSDLTAQPMQHQISAISRPVTSHRLDRTYSTTGNFTVKVTISNAYLTGVESNASQSVWIQPNINDTRFVPVKYVLAREPCNIALEPHTGVDVKYNWSYSDSSTTESTSVPVSTYSYSSAGPGFINVTAFTVFENKTNSTSFQIIERVNISALVLDGQIFGNDSAATVVLATGTDYNCTFSISPGSTYYVSSNAMRIPPLANIGYYNVNATCTNFLTSDSRSNVLYVEVPVTTFQLVTKAAEVNVAIQLKFRLNNCTHPKFEALLLNLTRAMTYNEPLLEVDMEPVTIAAVGKYVLISRAYNNVSDVLTVMNFTVQERIAGLNITIDNAVQEIGSVASFKISMTKGSGVQIDLAFGDGNSFNYTTEDIEPWGGRIILPNTTYATGGDYTVTLNASNLLGFEVLTLTVHVIAPLGIYQLVGPSVATLNTPVGFQLQLVVGSPPSLTTANFTWGDGTPISTFNNVQLNVDYNHTYTAVGGYAVSFSAKNPIPSTASNSTSIIVVKPIENPTVLFTPPVLAKGEVARAIVNVDSGTNITITLNPGDGNPAITYWIDSASTSTVVMNATYIINGTFTMNLTICNPYHCFVYTNNLPVVNKLDSGTLGLTNAGNVTFGRPLEFTFTYSGASADAPYGAMIEVRDSSDAVVQNSPVVIPITTLNLFPPVAGYIDYTFFVYNNGSNFTVAGPRIGTFTNITNLNFTLKYRTPGDTKLSSGYGPNQLMFPNKKDLVAVPTSDGYIQGYILSIEPIPVNVSAIKLCVFASNESAFKYIETTGAFEVTLTAWNPMSNATVTMNITVGGSILGGRVVDNDGVTKPKETRSVSLVWDVISDDTCVFVDLGLPQYRYVYGPANCNTTCGSSFDDTYQYTGALVTNNRLDFNVVYDKRGTYQVNVFACNEFTNSSFSGTLAVSNAKCRPPVVVFTDARYSTPDSPREILRSDQAIIECRIIELPCELTLSNKREWYFYKLDPISFGVIGSVNVTALPSSGNTILAVPKLFLDVGLYKVTVRVVMNTSITIEEFANSTSMYLQVGSSPLFIALNNGGMSEVKLTTRRQICLQPKMFSRDPDVNSTSVSNQGIGGWIYHCYQEGEAEPSDNSLTPLQTPKPSSFDFTGSPPAASGCFSSPPGIVSNDGSGVLCFDGRNLLSGRTYIFKVQGTKSGRKGKASIRIQMVDNLPATVVLRCRFLSACRRVASMTDFQIVNPSETVQLSGSCNCSESPSACQSTSWHVKYLNHLNVWVDVDDTTRSQFIEGTSNSEISFSPGLFNSVNSRKYRVCLNVANGTDYDGEGCIQLFTNTMPTAGTCSCNATSGVAGISGFNITCSGYRDDDGIDSYKFFLVKEVNGKTSSLLLGYNHKPHFIGPFPFFSEVVTIQVVVSDVYGATVSNNYTQISLSKPSKAHTDSVIKSILGGSAPLLKTLNKGDMQDTCNELQNIAALVVESSHSEISKLTGDDSVTTAGSGYGDGTTNGERKIEALPPDVQAVYQKDRNDRAEVFKKLTTFLTTLTTADAKQVELVAGSMKGITEAMDDLPRSAQIGCKNKAIEMVGTLSHISDSVGKEQMEAIVTPLLTTLSQTMSACSAQVDWGITGDIEESKKSEYYEYDTDWESDRQGFMKSSSTLEAGSKFIKETNGVVQGKVSKEVSSDSIGAIEDLTVMLASKQVQGDKPLVIVTPQLSLVINNTSPDSLSGVQISAGRSSFSMPKGLCELTKASTSSGQCSGPNSAIAMAAFAMPTNPFPKMPTNNGDCSIPKSAEVVTLNLRGKDGKEIRIDNTGNNGVFEININKDPTFVEPKFTDPNPHQPIPRIPEGMEVPGSAEGPFEKNKKIYQKLILHDFQLTGNDQSVHFQVEFENFTRNVTKCRQFLVVGRLWHPPSLMDPEKGFDWWGMIPTNTEYCRVYPGADEPDPFTFFVSNDKFNKVKAKVRSRAPDWDKDVNKVKFGVRELEEEEFNKYTENNPPPIPYPYSKQFTIKYKVRIFSASCYATRRNEDSWSTSGCTVGNKTTVRTTQCLCSHLTSFAGGWVESPNTIDWNYVFSNFDFTKNPTLFVTQIVIAVLFTLIFIWARHGDKKDLEKLGVTPLYDNNPEHKYLYEIVVSTGMRRGAGTESKVHFILSGERDETDIRPLEDKKRKVLQRGCADRFLMAVERPLGALNFLRIWHDNSGRGASASWYCNSVVVIDLQTRRRYHFVLNRWLAVEEDDGVVDRVVPVAGLEELKDFNYMFSTQTKKDLTDGHLWLSIMARPPESRFTRVERVACCLFLLFLTMVTTCMFYQKEGPTKASATSGLNIGPFR